MGRHMEDIREMLCDELDKIGSQGELNAGSLDTIDKLAHSIKSLDTIMAMEESGYSQTNYDEHGHNYMRGNAYPRRSSRRGNSYRYSRDEGREQMVERLEDMMNEAQDNTVKQAIQKAIRHIEG